MDATKEAVIEQGLTLSDADRREVVERLAGSLGESADVSAAWDAEIDRRLDAIATGRATFVPWEQARRQIVGDPGGPPG